MVYVLYVRQGRLNGGQAFPFTGQEFPDEELIASFVNLYYDQDNVLPDEVLLPLRPEDGVETLARIAHRAARASGCGCWCRSEGRSCGWWR